MNLLPEPDAPINKARIEVIESSNVSRPAAASDGTPTGTSGGTGASDGSGGPAHRVQCLPTPNGRLPNGVHLSCSYPLMTFGGYITYSRTARDVERASKELVDIIDSRKQGGNRVPIGFDIEWKPTFKKGEPARKAAVIQLCLDKSRCYVMHIIHSGMPSILQLLLQDSSSVKVGVGIANDAMKLRNDYNVHVGDVEDLSSLANRKLGGTPKHWSLSYLTELITCKKLAKPKRIRLGNWEAKMLSRRQLKYAATDAFASWYLYEALAQLPDAIVKNESALPAEASVDKVNSCS